MWDYSAWFEEWLSKTDRVVKAARLDVSPVQTSVTHLNLHDAIIDLDNHRALLEAEIDIRERR